MDLGLTGRTAAVAGGSAGLGFATAQALANDGVRVVVCGRDEKRATDAAAKIGNSCVGISCDVSSVAGGESFVEQATKILGQIDILILNSGGPPAGTFASTKQIVVANRTAATLAADFRDTYLSYAVTTINVNVVY